MKTPSAIQARLEAAVRSGVPLVVAARGVGLPEAVLFDWLDQGEAGYSDELANFYTTITKAESEVAASLSQMIVDHALNDSSSASRVSAARWYLETVWSSKLPQREKPQASQRSALHAEIDEADRDGRLAICQRLLRGASR